MMRLILGAFLAFFLVTAYATPKPDKVKWCNYTDHFHLSNSTLVTPAISGQLLSSGGVMGKQVDGTRFDIVDMQQGGCNWSNDGVVMVTYALNADDYCVINFIDGPKYYHPNDSNYYCKGKLIYLGKSYDGFMSYSYSLKFGTR
jgi:hypothetical protein